MEFWKSMLDHFRGFIAMDMGNGRNTSFWEDKWCFLRSLWLEFPSIFNIALNREALVADCCGHNGEGSR